MAIYSTVINYLANSKGPMIDGSQAEMEEALLLACEHGRADVIQSLISQKMVVVGLSLSCHLPVSRVVWYLMPGIFFNAGRPFPSPSVGWRECFTSVGSF